MFGLAIERQPANDGVGDPSGLPLTATVVLNDPAVLQANVTTLPDGTVMAVAPDTLGPIVATRQPDGTIVTVHAPIPVATQVAHNTLTDLLTQLQSPLAYIEANPMITLGVLGIGGYLLFKKKKR